MSRFNEPSTWAGFAAVLLSLAPMASAYPTAVIGIKAAATICGAIAVALREQAGGATAPQ